MSEAISFKIVWEEGDRSRTFNRSRRKGDLRRSRRPQLIQEVNNVLRSGSHEAPPRLTLWNPCEWLVWNVCMCECFQMKDQLNLITIVAVNNGVSTDTLSRWSLAFSWAWNTVYFHCLHKEIDFKSHCYWDKGITCNADESWEAKTCY